MRLHHDVPKKKIKQEFKEFRGDIYQIPPVRSAVKRALRTRRIHDSRIIEIDGKHVLFNVTCEAGTYIRTFCRDIGEALGVGAHLADLRRTRTCGFTEEDSFTLHQLKDAFVFWKQDGDDREIRRIVLPFERLFDHMPRVVVKDSAASAVSHGAPLAIAGIVELSRDIKPGDRVAVLSIKGEGMAIGRCVMTIEEIMAQKKGIAFETERVLLTGVYPKMWKKRKEK
jgi:H/ACA ribonucleoprotein complex subunit 4